MDAWKPGAHDRLMDYDKTQMPSAYDAGRGYAPATLALWMAVIARGAPDEVTRILDLGCGTGRFSRPLAEHFDAQVIAIDPSEKMLAEARKKTSSRVRYERAAGEQLPMEDSSVDMVFMSMVLHHFSDCAAVIGECRRVLRPSGHVCLRAGTLEQLDHYGFMPFFPSASALERKVLQPRAAIEALFRDGGFSLLRHELVRSPVSSGWSDYADRVSHRADSILVQLSDAEFAAGLTALRTFATTRPASEEVAEPVDFFVFRKQ